MQSKEVKRMTLEFILKNDYHNLEIRDLNILRKIVFYSRERVVCSLAKCGSKAQ